MLNDAIIFFHLLTALGVTVLVLLQQGKGADAGASFGAGASNTVFGSQGSATFLSKATAILAASFFMSSMGLGYFAKEKAEQLTQVGLPDPVALKAQAERRATNGTPVLQEQQSSVPTTSVAPAQERK